jgi:hypothetical protein
VPAITILDLILRIKTTHIGKKKSKNYKKVTIEDALNEREAYRVAHKQFPYQQRHAKQWMPNSDWHPENTNMITLFF